MVTTASVPCRQCQRVMVAYGGGLDPCECGSGMCDDCCCGWAERCPDCGSTDHEQGHRSCSCPFTDRAIREYERRCADRLRGERSALLDMLAARAYVVGSTKESPCA
jgi:hypothetical protein